MESTTTSLRFGGRLLFLLLLSSSASAITLNWVAPSENVDGTPLTDLDAYRIYYGTSSRNYSNITHFNDPTLTTFELCLPNGDYYFAMTALDAEGNESGYSNEVLKTELGSCGGPSAEPLPPVVLELPMTAYTVVKQQDRFVLLPVGTVPAGTLCDLNNSVNGHGAVPTADVVWTSPTGSRPIVVVAQCGG